MTRHVSTEALARLREGDLSARKAARIEAHLAGCARCRAASDGLADVQAVLASIQAPPIPHHLATRIENALAAEASRRSTSGSGQPVREGVSSRGPALRRRPWMASPRAARVLAGTAVVAALAGGYEIVTHTAKPAASSFSGAPAVRHPAAGVAAGALRSGASASSGPALQYRLGSQAIPFTPLATGADFLPGRLPSQVRTIITRGGSGLLSAAPASPGSTGNARATPNAEDAPARSFALRRFHGVLVPQLEACVTRISAGRRVVLVDVARYRGRPATVIVTAARTAAEQIWVVGPACSGSRSDILAQQPLPAP